MSRNDKTNAKQECNNSIVTLITIEAHDQSNEKTIARAVKEIEKSAKDNKETNLVLFPFAHLSSKLAKPELAQEIVAQIKSKLIEKYTIIETPFGVTKETLFHIHAHAGNVRFREL